MYRPLSVTLLIVHGPYKLYVRSSRVFSVFSYACFRFSIIMACILSRILRPWSKAFSWYDSLPNCRSFLHSLSIDQGERFCYDNIHLQALFKKAPKFLAFYVLQRTCKSSSLPLCLNLIHLFVFKYRFSTTTEWNEPPTVWVILISTNHRNGYRISGEIFCYKFFMKDTSVSAVFRERRRLAATGTLGNRNRMGGSAPPPTSCVCCCIL